MSANTPLLSLLNELLNGNREQQQQGLRCVLDKIDAIVGGGLPPRSSPLTSCNLVSIIEKLLKIHPEYSRTSSSVEGSFPLHFAASLGDVKVASVLLDHYPEAAFQPNAKGKIPLHYAAREGRVDMVRLFVSVAPKTAAIKSKKDKLALHFAAGEGHVAIVQALLTAYPQGASVPSAKGKVPLHFAARWGHIPIALDLLFLCPDCIRTLDWEGSLPLHDAAREGQYLMSRFLVERFPAALATANLRGDIPLFPAVRSGNADLVAFLVQVWPEGGRYVLNNINEEDCVAEWDQESLFLLLRGAVNNFDGCELVNQRNQPNVRLTSAYIPVPVSQPPEEAQEFGVHGRLNELRKAFPQIASKPFNVFQPRLLEHDSEATVSSSTISKKRSRCKEKPRSKSPALEDASDDEGSCQKRTKCCGNCFQECKCYCSVSESTRKQRVFLPVHAAFESDASKPVINYILDKDTEKQMPNIYQRDTEERYALHHAVKWAKDDPERATLVAERVVQPFPEAASKPDIQGNFPLWDAICENADTCLIKSLISAHPPAAVAVVENGIRPVELACHRACTVDTIYQLLRVDPSFLESKIKAK